MADVEQFDWGYHVIFDVTANWYEVPLSGTQDADYILEDDGSVSVEDTLELVSLNEYDGGAWEIELSIKGNLARSDGGSGGNVDDGGSGLPPWFDNRSGKTRR